MVAMDAVRDKVLLSRRGDFYDVFINGKHRGSGTWAYVSTAHAFYLMEGMRVEINE